MKYLFVISMAVFVFAISCAKKDNKPSIGKPGNDAKLECKGKDGKDGKDKDNKTCIEQAKKEADEAAKKGKVDPNVEGGPSGSPDAKAELDTIPNLREFERMAINLSKETALIANIKSAANNIADIATQVVCPESLSKLNGITTADPDKLQIAKSQILLFNNSSIVASLSVSNGDKTSDSKLYMVTCNSGSKETVENYIVANKTLYNVVNLKKGQNVFESVAMNGKGETGILTSFECNDDEQILKGTAKMVGEYAGNRIRMRKGSSLMVFRAGEQKIGEKKLRELGTEAQKNQEHSIISCEG